MTTLAEARAELAQIAERQAALQKIVDAAPKSLVQPGGEGGFCLVDIFEHDSFASFKQRNAYADALDTLLMLRHQPGTEPVSDQHEQYMVTTNDDSVHPIVMYASMRKITRISPCFATEADAQAAIDTIGADRILRMFRTLHGVA